MSSTSEVRVRQAGITLVVVIVVFTAVTAISRKSLVDGLLYGGLPALIVGGLALGAVILWHRSQPRGNPRRSSND